MLNLVGVLKLSTPSVEAKAYDLPCDFWTKAWYAELQELATESQPRPPPGWVIVLHLEKLIRTICGKLIELCTVEMAEHVMYERAKGKIQLS
jgi:hypothetical protein